MFRGRRICVVLPALNEEKTICACLQSLPEFVDLAIVVDDGSTDNTAALARSCGAVVVSHGTNRGLGIAFRTGTNQALLQGADIMVTMDADGQFSSEYIQELIEPICSGRAGFVTASRFKDPTKKPQMTWVKYAGNRFMAGMVSRIVSRKLHDVSCGFRAYSREALLRLNLFGDFTYTQETMIDLAFKRIPIEEVPVLVRGTREFGKSRVASNLVRYGVNTLRIITGILRDYKAFKIFGGLSLVLLAVAFVLSAFTVWHFWSTGGFSPHKWAPFAAGGLYLLAALLFIIGYTTDMLTRIMRNQDELLYLQKLNFYTHAMGSFPLETTQSRLAAHGGQKEPSLMVR